MCVLPVLPSGFSIAPGSAVSPDSWAALHRAVFPRVGMSAEWRRGIMRPIDYGSNLRPHNNPLDEQTRDRSSEAESTLIFPIYVDDSPKCKVDVPFNLINLLIQSNLRPPMTRDIQERRLFPILRSGDFFESAAGFNGEKIVCKCRGGNRYEDSDNKKSVHNGSHMLH